MMPADQLCSNGLKYKQEALVMKNFLEFFIAILEAWLPQSSSLGVSLL